MTDLNELLERQAKDDWCRKCGGTGWLRFKCGTPWMCTCNPARFPLKFDSPISLTSERTNVQ